MASPLGTVALLQRDAATAAAAGGKHAGVKDGISQSSVTHHKQTQRQGFPVTTYAGGDDRFWWALASSQGRRPSMEDKHVVDLALDAQGTSLFCVFDGHAGKEVAAFCANHIREMLLSTRAYAEGGDMEAALHQAFLALEDAMNAPAARQELYCLRQGIPLAELARRPADAAAARAYGVVDAAGCYLGPRAGATACVALVRGDTLAVANVGDSRCVLADSGSAVALTHDHTAKDPREAARVLQAGLQVQRNRVVTGRSSLAMTRSVGDKVYKRIGLPHHAQPVSPVPDTTSVQVDTQGGAAAGTPEVQVLGVADFLLLACDGLWDVMSNQQAVTFLHVTMQRGLSPQQAALALVDEALSQESVTPPTRDNITLLLVQFAPMPGSAA